MLIYKNFKDVFYQASIFTPLVDFREAFILKNLLDKYGETFDGDPAVIPLPKEVPGDIPKIVLTSSDELWKIHIAKERVDIFGSGSKIARSEFYTFAIGLFGEYKMITRARIGRLAAVIKRFLEIENPSRELVSQYCKQFWLDTSLNRPMDFKLHAYKKYKYDDRIPELNSWIRHNVGDVKLENGIKKRGIIVEQDLNTPQAKIDTEDLKRDFIEYFFIAIQGAMDEILELYYPEEVK